MKSGVIAFVFIFGPWLGGILFYLAQKTQVRLKLPEGVMEAAPSNAEVQIEILWQPDLPTGGFPVLPATKAA